MKIVITSKGDTLDSPVDPRFGRAAKFILFDTDTEAVRAVDNTQNLNAAQGAGIQSAQTVVELGADCLVSGHCGPKAFRVLSATGVKVFHGAQGTVADAIEALKNGTLTAAESADVEGHW